MVTAVGALRRILMAPSLDEVTFARRGFPVEETAQTRALETIPQAVVCGFEWAIEAGDPKETERHLALVDPELQGFAYEGATMACVVRDAMGPGKGHRTLDLLRGPGAPHIFLNYIGIGFAMARLPRPLWKKVLPDLSDSAEGPPLYPQMSWLAVDGYGFDKAYFDTARHIDAQHTPAVYPWQGDAGYFPRAVDQGIGRALWFIHGAHTEHVDAAVRRFASARHADLWSGVGLAATFAGSSHAEDLAALRRLAGEHAPQVAQGSVFAGKARHHSGVVPEHTRIAVRELAGLSVEDAAALADDCAVESGDGTLPAYELWRESVRGKLPVNTG
ncbi:DUF1702 family protein [Streptomyces sp. CB02460]|uniref:DUF1702 family protein n=1 Tax=Streptomyces sp. CB02460 TaxID=1703941 RepID=UPI0018FE6DE2|nr:DUF1702 family protein [Streptomyces sp. CB02460]